MGSERGGIEVKQTAESEQIEISFQHDETSIQRKWSQLIRDFFVSGIAYTTISLGLLSMFELKSVSIFTVILGLLFLLFFHFFYEQSTLMLKVFFSFLLLIIFLVVVFHSYIINGLNLTTNQMIKVIGTHTGNFFPLLDVTIKPELYTLATSSFWAVFSIIISLFCFLMVKSKNNLLLWLFVITFFTFQVSTGITPAIYYNVAIFFCSILMVNYSFVYYQKENVLIGKSKNYIVIFTSVILFFLFFLTFLFLNVVEPASNYSKNKKIVSFKQYLSDEIYDFRYEKDKTNTFTQGDFKKLGKLKLTDKEALEVVMEKPTSLYLRGFVGSKYTSDRWVDLDPAAYYDSYGLFYWLHKSEFYGLQQLSIVNQLNGSNDLKTSKITIHNLDANSQYIYAPYELNSKTDEFEHIKSFDDSQLKSTNFFGHRLYHYQSNDNLVKRYPALASQLYKNKDREEVKRYLKNESYYNEFIYEKYTEIPKDTRLLLEQYFDVVPNEDNKHLPYEKAIDIVKTFLNQHIKYKVDIESVPKEKDFFQYFLQESREGYATHYATTATLMFRYLGIPSRYVEGYLITPKDIKNKEKFEPITINGTNAHAWTEIYIDNIGWIPIEVTPPYYQVMEQTDLSNYPGQSQGEMDGESEYARGQKDGSQGDFRDEEQKNGTQGKQQITDDTQYPNATSNQQPKEKMPAWKKVIMGSSIILVLLFLAFILYIVKRRMELRRLKNSFEDDNYKVSIPKIFDYTLSLLHYAGLSRKGGSIYRYIEDIEQMYSKEYAEKFNQVIKINQQARFSTNKLSKEQHEQMKNFMDETLANLIQSKSVFIRMKMKFWDFVY